MAFFDLMVALLLFLNSVAILNEHRFLAKRGWVVQQNDFGGNLGAATTLKSQALGLINAVSYMRRTRLSLQLAGATLTLSSSAASNGKHGGDSHKAGGGMSSQLLATSA